MIVQPAMLDSQRVLTHSLIVIAALVVLEQCSKTIMQSGVYHPLLPSIAKEPSPRKAVIATCFFFLALLQAFLSGTKSKQQCFAHRVLYGFMAVFCFPRTHTQGLTNTSTDSLSLIWFLRINWLNNSHNYCPLRIVLADCCRWLQLTTGWWYINHVSEDQILNAARNKLNNKHTQGVARVTI